MHDKQSKKCEICVESKLTKKSCSSVQHETSLNHSDLTDLKQTMTRGSKSYFVTFIDDYSRYTKFYLIRHKDEAFYMFISYKAEVENRLNRKIKRLRYNRGGEYTLLNDFCEMKVLFMK